MKKCRWNIQRSVWAFIIILCCHGNFADDPSPSFEPHPDHVNQRQAQKTVPIGGGDEPAVLPGEAEAVGAQGPGRPAPIEGSLKPPTKEATTAPALDSGPEGEIPARSNSFDPPPSTEAENEDAAIEEDAAAFPAAVGAEGIVQTTESNPQGSEALTQKNPSFVEAVLLEEALPVTAAAAGSQPEAAEPAAPETESAGEEKRPKTAEETTGETMAVVQPFVTNNANDDPAAKWTAGEAENGTPSAAGSADVQRHPLDGGATPATEDMPSFSEWTKKRLEEQGSIPPAATSQQGKASGVKQVRHKNYASVDCGAKVISANPEAQSTGAVLSHYRDDYMLNPCTAKIWLIIELCESIQADRIDLANFELFSSSPREFSVYSSDRYPAREWTFLGTFTATDERTVQNFGFGHNTFGKYIKVEMVSHYGSEHFCPLSLVRVFGTSEYEALETEEGADSHGRGPLGEDDDEEAVSGGEQGSSSQESQNLFGSAKDVVMNIVKKVLRGDKSDGASSGFGTNIASTSSEAEPKSGSGNGCACLQRLPMADCGEGTEREKEAADGCRKEESVAHLRCHYPELLAFLSEGWSGSVHGRLLERCFSACAPYFEECGVVGNAGGATATYENPPACRFYVAALGAVRFGALCHLDKLLQEERGRLPVAVPQCPYANLTSDVSAPGLDLVHVPNATPPVLAFETVSSRAGGSGASMASSASSSAYVCDSLDHISVCSTLLDASDVGTLRDSVLDGGDSVIRTGAISTEEGSGRSEAAGSSSAAFQSQILPTRTLPAEAETALKSKTPLGEKVDSKAAPVPAVVELAAPANLKAERVSESPPVSEPLAPVAAKIQSKFEMELRAAEEKPDSESAAASPSPSIGATVSPSVVGRGGTSAAVVPKEAPVRAGAAAAEGEDATAAVLTPSAHFAKAAAGYGSDAIPEGEADSLMMYHDEEGSPAAPAPNLHNAPASGESAAAAGVGRPQNGFSNGAAGFAATPGQKESVFVRLSNRIKALELNMSLSGQYLEELSRRYRKQMEEMQKAFNKTIGALNETARNAYERDLKQQEMIMNLQVQLDSLYKVVLNLQEEQDGIHTSVVSRHILLMIVEASVMAALFVTCARTGQQQRARSGRAVSVVHPNNTSGAAKKARSSEASKAKRSSSLETFRRRNSDSNAVGRHCAGASNGLDVRDRRRQSTEALNVSGTYSELMIVEPTIPVWVDRPSLKEQEHSRRKKKHKNKNGGQQQQATKKELYRSVSNNVLLYSCSSSNNNNSQKPPLAPSSNKNPPSRKNSTVGVSSAGLLFGSTTGGTRSGGAVQELTRCEATGTLAGGRYPFSNLVGFNGSCLPPPPDLPPKLSSAKLPSYHQHNGLKKVALEKVCG